MTTYTDKKLRAADESRPGERPVGQAGPWRARYYDAAMRAGAAALNGWARPLGDTDEFIFTPSEAAYIELPPEKLVDLEFRCRGSELYFFADGEEKV